MSQVSAADFVSAADLVLLPARVSSQLVDLANAAKGIIMLRAMTVTGVVSTLWKWKRRNAWIRKYGLPKP